MAVRKKRFLWNLEYVKAFTNEYVKHQRLWDLSVNTAFQEEHKLMSKALGSSTCMATQLTSFKKMYMSKFTSICTKAIKCKKKPHLFLKLAPKWLQCLESHLHILDELYNTNLKKKKQQKKLDSAPEQKERKSHMPTTTTLEHKDMLLVKEWLEALLTQLELARGVDMAAFELAAYRMTLYQLPPEQLKNMWTRVWGQAVRRLVSRGGRGTGGVEWGRGEPLASYDERVLQLLLLYEPTLSFLQCGARGAEGGESCIWRRIFQLVVNHGLEPAGGGGGGRGGGGAGRRAWLRALRREGAGEWGEGAVLVQRRWHEVKVQARRSFLDRGRSRWPTKLQLEIIEKYPHVVLKQLPKWSELVDTEQIHIIPMSAFSSSTVHTPDQMDEDEEKDTTNEDDTDDIIVIENPIDTIEVNDEILDENVTTNNYPNNIINGVGNNNGSSFTSVLEDWNTDEETNVFVDTVLDSAKSVIKEVTSSGIQEYCDKGNSVELLNSSDPTNMKSCIIFESDDDGNSTDLEKSNEFVANLGNKNNDLEDDTDDECLVIDEKSKDSCEKTDSGLEEHKLLITEPVMNILNKYDVNQLVNIVLGGSDNSLRNNANSDDNHQTDKATSLLNCTNVANHSTVVENIQFLNGINQVSLIEEHKNEPATLCQAVNIVPDLALVKTEPILSDETSEMTDDADGHNSDAHESIGEQSNDMSEPFDPKITMIPRVDVIDVIRYPALAMRLTPRDTRKRHMSQSVDARPEKLLKLCRPVTVTLERVEINCMTRKTKKVELPNIEDVRRINSGILTAQVAPNISQQSDTDTLNGKAQYRSRTYAPLLSVQNKDRALYLEMEGRVLTTVHILKQVKLPYQPNAWCQLASDTLFKGRPGRERPKPCKNCRLWLHTSWPVALVYLLAALRHDIYNAEQAEIQNEGKTPVKLLTKKIVTKTKKVEKFKTTDDMAEWIREKNLVATIYGVKPRQIKHNTNKNMTNINSTTSGNNQPALSLLQPPSFVISHGNNVVVTNPANDTTNGIFSKEPTQVTAFKKTTDFADVCEDPNPAPDIVVPGPLLSEETLALHDLQMATRANHTTEQCQPNVIIVNDDVVSAEKKENQQCIVIENQIEPNPKMTAIDIPKFVAMSDLMKSVNKKPDVLIEHEIRIRVNKAGDKDVDPTATPPAGNVNMKTGDNENKVKDDPIPSQANTKDNLVIPNPTVTPFITTITSLPDDDVIDLDSTDTASDDDDQPKCVKMHLKPRLLPNNYPRSDKAVQEQLRRNQIQSKLSKYMKTIPNTFYLREKTFDAQVQQPASGQITAQPPVPMKYVVLTHPTNARISAATSTANNITNPNTANSGSNIVYQSTKYTANTFCYATSSNAANTGCNVATSSDAENTGCSVATSSDAANINGNIVNPNTSKCRNVYNVYDNNGKMEKRRLYRLQSGNGPFPRPVPQLVVGCVVGPGQPAVPRSVTSSEITNHDCGDLTDSFCGGRSVLASEYGRSVLASEYALQRSKCHVLRVRGGRASVFSRHVLLTCADLPALATAPAPATAFYTIPDGTRPMRRIVFDDQVASAVSWSEMLMEGKRAMNSTSQTWKEGGPDGSVFIRLTRKPFNVYAKIYTVVLTLEECDTLLSRKVPLFLCSLREGHMNQYIPGNHRRLKLRPDTLLAYEQLNNELELYKIMISPPTPLTGVAGHFKKSGRPPQTPSQEK